MGGLSEVLGNAEGAIPYTTFDNIRKAFPRATFESAADLLMRMKLVWHSEEEIALFEKVTEVSEAGLQALIEVARPGVMHRDVWVHVYQVMLEATGEPPYRCSFRAGASGNTSLGDPLDEILPAGKIVNQELCAALLGLNVQINHSFLLGSPAPADWPAAAEYCIDILHSLVDWITPGKSFKDLCEFYAQRRQGRPGADPSEAPSGSVLVRLSGWGDGPRFGVGRMEGLDDLLIEAGMVFTMKVSGFSLAKTRLQDGSKKASLLRAIDRSRSVLPMRSVLRVLRLSQSRYNAWKREGECSLDDLSSCPQSTPQQLTRDEVEVIREMVTSDEYRHVPTGKLARLGQRLGRVFASPTTWYLHWARKPKIFCNEFHEFHELKNKKFGLICAIRC